MSEPLKASIGELAHVSAPELQRALRQGPKTWARFAPAGIAIAAGALTLFALLKWRRAI